MNEFQQVKAQILQLADNVEQLVQKYEASATLQQLSELMQSIQKEQFEIIVLGEFSNGKSTFINALLGEEILPASLKPTTTILTKIQHSTKIKYELVYRNKKQLTISSDDFTNLVAPNHAKMSKEEMQSYIENVIAPIQYAQISYPTEICQQDVILIDSPGMNDNDALREAVTTNYIPKSDAAFFVINGKKAMSQTEMELLQRIYDKDIQKIFFIINFADLLKADEQQEVYNYVKEHIGNKVGEPKIYLTAARPALIHQKLAKGEKLDKRATRKLIPYEETGISHVKEELLQFLVYEKGAEKVRRITVALASIIEQFLTTTIEFEIDTIEGNKEDKRYEIEHLQQQLTYLPKEHEKSAKVAANKMQRAQKTILTAYKKELMGIASTAVSIMEQGIEKGTHAESIKRNIEEAVGQKESKLTEVIQNKIRKVLKETIAEQAATIQQQFQVYYSTNSYILPSYSTWDYKIEYAWERRNEGGFFRSIFTIFAPNFLDRMDDSTDLRSEQRAIAKLKEQVHERFVNPIDRKVEVIEKTIDAMLEEAQRAMDLQIEQRMQDDELKYTRALSRLTQDDQQLQQLLQQLKQEQQQLLSWQKHIETIAQQYCEVRVNR